MFLKRGLAVADLLMIILAWVSLKITIIIVNRDIIINANNAVNLICNTTHNFSC